MDTNANCPAAAQSGSNAVLAGRVLYKGGVATLPTSAVTSLFKDDFLLASAYQDSFSGTGVRGSEKCD
jgi:hypothetical protein